MITDALGNELTVGDVFTLPGRSGSNLYTNIYRVEDHGDKMIWATKFQKNWEGEIVSTRKVRIWATKVHPAHYPPYVKEYLEKHDNRD